VCPGGGCGRWRHVLTPCRDTGRSRQQNETGWASKLAAWRAGWLQAPTLAGGVGGDDGARVGDQRVVLAAHRRQGVGPRELAVVEGVLRAAKVHCVCVCGGGGGGQVVEGGRAGGWWREGWKSGGWLSEGGGGGARRSWTAADEAATAGSKQQPGRLASVYAELEKQLVAV
jgi:hypothetical protein